MMHERLLKSSANKMLVNGLIGPRVYGRRTKRTIRTRPKGKVVAHTGFEPVVFALRGRCPGPLDECATQWEIAGLEGRA